MTTINDTKQHLANLFKARFPMIYMESWEENRIINLINEIAEDKELIKTNRTVYTWSSTMGLINTTTKKCNK